MAGVLDARLCFTAATRGRHECGFEHSRFVWKIYGWVRCRADIARSRARGKTSKARVTCGSSPVTKTRSAITLPYAAVTTLKRSCSSTNERLASTSGERDFRPGSEAIKSLNDWKSESVTG